MDIIIVLLIFFHVIQCQKIISIPYTFNYNDYQIQIQFPSIDKKLRLMLDMIYDYTFIRQVSVEDSLLKDKPTLTINHHKLAPFREKVVLFCGFCSKNAQK